MAGEPPDGRLGTAAAAWVAQMHTSSLKKKHINHRREIPATGEMKCGRELKQKLFQHTDVWHAHDLASNVGAL